MTQDTIAACSGGALPAAIGIVRLSGPDTGAIIDKIFVPKDEIPITKKKTYHAPLLITYISRFPG